MDPRSLCQALTESVLTIRLIVAHRNLEGIADLARVYEHLDRLEVLADGLSPYPRSPGNRT